MLLTRETSHFPIFWLNDVASLNISFMSLTFETFNDGCQQATDDSINLNTHFIYIYIYYIYIFQSPTSWSNDDAPWNISPTLVTLKTSHNPISWWNDIALANIQLMSVTLETFHWQDKASSIVDQKYMEGASTARDSTGSSKTFPQHWWRNQSRKSLRRPSLLSVEQTNTELEGL